MAMQSCDMPSNLVLT